MVLKGTDPRWLRIENDSNMVGVMEPDRVCYWWVPRTFPIFFPAVPILMQSWNSGEQTRIGAYTRDDLQLLSSDLKGKSTRETRELSWLTAPGLFKTQVQHDEVSND